MVTSDVAHWSSFVIHNNKNRSLGQAVGTCGVVLGTGRLVRAVGMTVRGSGNKKETGSALSW
jgi:uncharacterized membrane protein YecN with MAPEG domain